MTVALCGGVPYAVIVDDAKRYLDLAARAALRGVGRVEPNPPVGCVLVRDGAVIAIGHHRRFGGLHAEREAIAAAASRGETVRGSTAYVTLEPCNAHGKQPPCVQALIEAGIAEVVYARADPNPLKAGGHAALEAAGVRCTLSGASPLATSLAAPFVHRMMARRPWVIAKWAQTIDGRVATRTGESKWISNEWSRARVQRLRGRVDAILTGIGTVVTDDPMLNARTMGPSRRVAARVVADTDLDIPLDCRLVKTAREYPTLVACDAHLLASDIVKTKREALLAAGVEFVPVNTNGHGHGLRLPELMNALMQRCCWTVMVESGPGLLGSLLELDLVDEAVVYVAPLVLADDNAKPPAGGRVVQGLAGGTRMDLCRVKRIVDDVELVYRRRA
jgi:diaminohydroxyphosphoribosylaminopyrimidine deaminase/5-amino-6-(5-phosphoribosylamino)uracil reductase